MENFTLSNQRVTGVRRNSSNIISETNRENDFIVTAY